MRNLFGLIIVLFGLGMLLQQFNIPWASSVFSSWWALAIIIVGLYAWNGNQKNWFGPMIIVLVGVVLLLDQLNVFTKSAWNFFWPVAIILVGGRIILGRSWSPSVKQETGGPDASVLFSGIERKVSGHFEKGNVSAWFGGVKMDMRDANFATQSTLNISSGFGGVEVWLPKDVHVVSKLAAILGGTDDKTSPSTDAKKTLTITGSAMFGGISLRN